MKTAEEIMKEVANKHSYSTWGEMMYDTHEHSQVEYTAEAMKYYASQAIDRCSEVAKIVDTDDNDEELHWLPEVTRYNENRSDEIFMVSKNSILNVKSELK